MRPTREQEDAEFKRRAQRLEDYMNTEEYRKFMVQRLQLLDAGTNDLEKRGLIFHLCQREENPAEGCIFFIENFGWTFNPKMEPKHFPFKLYPFQKEAIRKAVDSIINGRDIFIEKSREMGATWMFFAYIPLWFWLFREGSEFLVGSYKEKLVDDGTSGSIFGKIDYAMESLPKWMLPNNFNKLKHRTKLKLTNPSNGNLIAGDTMNPRFGRGDRKTAILFDELGFWDYAKSAWDASGDATNCRIANSTPSGYNFYGMLRETGIDIVSMHWHEHPLKDDAWYRYECSRRDDESIAQELDISYSKSREGRVYPEWNEENVERGKFDYDPTLPLFVSWDFGKSDDTAIIWAQRTNRGKIRIVDTYRNSGHNIDFYIPFVNGYQLSDSYKYKKEDLDIIDKHRNWKSAIHFGDPAGRFQNQVTDQSVIDVLKTYGVIINYKEAWKAFSVRKSAAKRLIKDGVEMDKNPRTDYFNICMLNAAYPKVKVDGIETVRSEQPRHDSTSHYRTSFEYLSMGLEDMPHKRTAPIDKFPKINMFNSNRRRAIRY